MANQPTVLIVDDEPEIGHLLKLFLEGDFDVVTFTDPRLACEEVAKRRFDLVVSDIKMPFLTGLEVVQHVKNVSPSTHVVLITGHAQTEKDKAQARALGAAGVLFKPFGDPLKVVEYLGNIIGAEVVKPLSPNSAPTAAPVSSPITSGSEKQATGKPAVLIIDDEVDLTDVLSMLLEDDFDVVVYNNPLEALKGFNQRPFKAVLTDLNMPQMSGKDVIGGIRAISKTVPIVIMTGHGESEPEVQEALKQGGTAILSKPFPDPTSILEKIKKQIK